MGVLCIHCTRENIPLNRAGTKYAKHTPRGSNAACPGSGAPYDPAAVAAFLRAQSRGRLERRVADARQHDATCAEWVRAAQRELARLTDYAAEAAAKTANAVAALAAFDAREVGDV